MTPPRGKLFALEGIDGSGTTTQVARLCDALEREGWRTLRTAEPSTGTLGRLLRSWLQDPAQVMAHESQALLFAADRMEHLSKEIEPALAAGKIVVTDRYVMSSWVYQSMDLPLAWIRSINAQARLPDATFFLRVASDTAAMRRMARGGVLERFENENSQRQVATRYEDIVSQPDVGMVHTIDGEADEDRVFKMLWQKVTLNLQVLR